MPERTLIILKPDAVQRQITGQVISRFEQKGLKLVAAKFMQITKELAEQHYGVHKGKDFFENAVNYLSSSPVMVMVWEGAGVINMSRKMMGKTFGYEAEPGTIRGDFGNSRSYNLIHGSDSEASAEFEIGLYFKSEDIVDYDLTNAKWLYGPGD